MLTWSAPHNQSSSLYSSPFPSTVVNTRISVVNDGFLNIPRKARSFPQSRIPVLLSAVLPITTSSSVFPTSSAPVLTSYLYSENCFALLSEESLCDVPLDLGFNDVIEPRRKRHYISAAGLFPDNTKPDFPYDPRTCDKNIDLDETKNPYNQLLVKFLSPHAKLPTKASARKKTSSGSRHSVVKLVTLLSS